MATLREELLNILLDLNEDQFKLFKFHLRDDGIPLADLEKADRPDTVELMINKYLDRGALKVTLKVLQKISRNDLVERLQNFRPKVTETKEPPTTTHPLALALGDFVEEQSLDPLELAFMAGTVFKDFNPFHVGAHTEGSNKKKARPLRWVQQFAVEVTLDPETAHRALFLSDDGKQVHDGDVWKNLPDNPKRFKRCVNVLGKQSFSSGKFYYEVQVKGKTSWTLGVAKESIKRRGQITLGPDDGFWTIWLRNGDEYMANDDTPVCLTLNHHPQKVGVFVNYEEGLVSFYDVEAADHLYTFTDCSFTEKLYPFFSPCTNDGGTNSAPLIICPINHDEAYQRKKAELQSVQQFAVDVTLDTDTAHPNLILSDDGKQVHHGDVRKKLPDSRKRFNSCVNVLGKQSFSSGRFYFEVQVKGKRAWTVGVAKKSIDRKGKITLSPEDGFWTVWLRNGDEYSANDDHPVRLSLNQRPRKVGVFVDYEEGLVSFYDVEATDLLYSFTNCSFTEKLYPYLSPCNNDNGRNSAPLIVSPVSHNEEYERKKAELQSVQQFAVDVTLDPDTAHPALFLSDDRKQVHDGDVWKKLPDSPKRFNSCVNVLGKESFSSGKFYFEVQVKGKTTWTVGVAKESIDRKGNITLGPKYGFWTVGLRNGDEYKAIASPSVNLSLNQRPQKVGVFVNYEEGQVSFYDVEAADLLYSFTGCSFTEKLYPFFSPCTNEKGRNSAPLIISPVKHNEEYERKKAELQSVQHFAVEVTLDTDTAHPALILSGDGKQVHHGDVCQNLPDSPERFNSCVNVLGKESFSSGKFYFEVQVKGKTAWTVGVAKESIDRKGKITFSPKYGFWTVGFRNLDEYTAYDAPSVDLSLKMPPQKVGVFVNYEEGLVSFYDVEAADLLYSFTNCSFTEKLYPLFCPCTNDKGRNSAPLIISPVSHNEEYERKKAELQSVQQFAVDVTLDPDTAHPALFLSDDRKQVHDGDVWKKLPDSPKRFDRCVNVLGKESFSSGKFYFEVQVKGKRAWTVGVAKESIDRNGDITLGPKYGFWTVGLRNGDEYTANDAPSVDLSLKMPLQKVGVFVNYEDGLVCFYDVDSADLLYAFTDCSFTEKLFPYFSPCTNDNGRNSGPLIICPVNRNN
ncbi:uncharacterized protein LOC130163832 [Seriola aureovittata]|uniref:uncharacterized protein LOC130163832 n=1 Tax=Seriola aureovittata TaxID=2871759 RepID=UPI0024BDD9BF|nr:uncharacterized protein LOC130163832 [Seriola aureovittata]